MWCLQVVPLRTTESQLVPIESSSLDEGGTVGMDEVESDLCAFDNNINPEDSKSSMVTSLPQRQTAPPTPNKSVMEITNERMVNIHFGQNRRGSLDSAKFTAEQMQQFINKLDGRSISLQPIYREGHDLVPDRKSGKEVDHRQHVGASDGRH